MSMPRVHALAEPRDLRQGARAGSAARQQAGVNPSAPRSPAPPASTAWRAPRPAGALALAALAALLALQAAIVPSASAGSRGHTAVFVEAGRTGLFERPAYAMFRDGEYTPTDKAQACWQRRATGGERFGLIVRKTLPQGWTADLAQALWSGQSGALAKAQRILASQRASDGTAYDGAIVFRLEQGRLSLLALGARTRAQPRHLARAPAFAWDDAHPASTAQALDEALCAVAQPLGVGFQP